MMRGVQPFRHGGGKPEGKEGVQYSQVRERPPINLYFPRALVWAFLLYPGQTGTGQKCSNGGIPCPHLNICAPKPHRRWGPRMQPQPKIKDFRPGTPIYPVPVVSQCVPVSVRIINQARSEENSIMSVSKSHALRRGARVKISSRNGGVRALCGTSRRRSVWSVFRPRSGPRR